MNLRAVKIDVSMFDSLVLMLCMFFMALVALTIDAALSWAYVGSSITWFTLLYMAAVRKNNKKREE